jgi:hypothetical protein
LGQIERLGQIVHGAVLQVLYGIAHLRMPAEHQDREIRIPLQRAREQLAISGSKQARIGKHACDLLPCQDAERLFAEARREHLVAAMGQMALDGLSYRRLSVHNQDPIRHSDRQHRSPRKAWSP